MNFGYARISTPSQQESLTTQETALLASGCDRVVKEVCSGRVAGKDRPALRDLIASLREGDTLTICRLDRLGRSLPDLLETEKLLRESGVA
jgi:DNA invertase Pin-like site-specific DNA recombinase